MERYGFWFQGAFTVLGIVQWTKGLWNPPKWVVVILTAVVAVLFVIAPDWGRNAAGVLAATQVGWDVVMQPAIAGAHSLKERVLTAGTSTGYGASDNREEL